MDLNFDLNLVQSQKLLLTPKIKQVLEVLRMTSQELFEYVEEQLETNPVLEIADNEGNISDEDYSIPHENGVWEVETGDDENDIPKYDESEWLRDEDAMDDRFVKLSLKDHLLFQMHMTNMEKGQIVIGEYLIDNIDENGYLSIDISEAAAYFNIPASKISKVLILLQTFDPPGICARNLKECLLIQLRQMDEVDSDIIDLVENELDDLAAKNFKKIAGKTGLEEKRVEEAFKLIKSLEPKPGREFSCSNELKFIIPDAIIKKIKGNYEVVINEDAIPFLNISKYYRTIESDEMNNEAKKFVQSRIDSASWLIKCIEQRKSTLRKIAEFIVGAETDFFEYGKSSLKTVPIKDVSQFVNIHESTLSKIIGGKYIQCTWGIFDLRYFIK
ncbi:MAG: RNA polymerase factor sigma-54 [Bacillota bacterium]|nr:RNA polymerase factor sigma-54 [Bacillota bacterium]